MPAKKLTVVETAWMAKLEAVLKACPSSRLACYTTGDNDLMFYDTNVAKEWEAKNPRDQIDAGELHKRAGSFLCTVTGTFNIDSCAG